MPRTQNKHGRNSCGPQNSCSREGGSPLSKRLIIPPRPVLLKLQCAYLSPGDLAKMQIPSSRSGVGPENLYF